MSAALRIESDSVATTQALGAALGRLLGPGSVVALHGELGAGKTTFTQGLARGFGVEEPVTSPTYLLCSEYPGAIPLLHLDAYFQQRMDALLAEGLVERFRRSCVVIEWAEQVEEWLPGDRIEVALEGVGEERLLVLSATGPASRALLERFRERLPEEVRQGPEPGEREAR